MGEESQLLDDVRNLSLDALVELLAAADRLRRLRDGTLGGSTVSDGTTQPRAPSGDAAAKPPPFGLGDLWFDLARIQLHHLRDLVDLSAHRSEQLFEAARRVIPAQRGSPGRVRPLLVLAGVSGDTARGELVVENRRSQPAELSFQPSPLRTRDGGRSFAAQWTIRATPSRVAPGGEAVVRVELLLDVAHLHPGDRYFGDLAVLQAGEVAQSG